jgi:Tfp pilus assembly protein PilO
MTDAVGGFQLFRRKAPWPGGRGGHRAEIERRSMLRRITVSILVMMLILAVGCGKTRDSANERTEFAPDEVIVQFKVAVDDSRVSDLLTSLGSRISQTYEYSDFVLVSVPEDKTVADMVESLSRSSLVKYAEPNYYCYAADSDPTS